MTIQASYYPVGVAGNGTTTVFGIPWPIRAQVDLVVQLINATTSVPISPPPVLNGGGTYDYVVTGTPDPNTGFYASSSVVFNTAPPATMDVLITRATLDWQDKSFPINARFPAKSVEAALDRRTLVDQEQGYLVGVGSGTGGGPGAGRIVQMSQYDLSGFNPTLPLTAGAAGMLLGENAAGTGFQWYSFANGPILNVIGTANQITVSPASAAGQIQISLPTKIFVPANYSYASGGASGIELAQYNSTGVVQFAGLNDLGDYVQLSMTGSQVVATGDNLPDAGYVFSNGSGGLVVGTNGPGIITFMVSGGFVGKWRADGTLLVNPPGPLSFNMMDVLANANQNAAVKAQNQSAGTQSMVSFYLQNNGSGVGSNTFLSMFGTNVASGGFQAPSRAALWTDGAGGLALATNAVAPLLFFINGVEVGRFHTNNCLGIGNPAPTNIVDVLQNVNAPAVINLLNPNTGNAAYAKVQFGNAANQSVLIHFGVNYTPSGFWRADGCALVGSGAGGLTLGTNAVSAQPIYFGIQGAEIARFDTSGRLGIGVIPTSVLHISQSNAGAFALAQIVNPSAAVNSGTMIQVVNDVGSAAQLMIYSSTTGGGVGSTAILSGTGSGGLYVKTAANAPVKFQVNNGNEAGRWDTDSYFKALGGYGGGIPTGNHYFYQTANGISILGIVHNVASPSGIAGIQILYSADPNSGSNDPITFYGGYGTTYQARFVVYSNGGVGNYSANNVNLSDANLKDHIEPLKAKVIADLWDAHRDMPWTRYRYKDQTHSDYNYGYLAQDVAKAFEGIAPELVDDFEQKEIDHPEKPGEKSKPTHASIKGVYAEDLHNIGHALLSEAQRRIEKLEALVATLTKEKRK